MHSALQQYQQVSAHGGVQDADPHHLIQLLFRAALDRIATARGAMENGDTARKGELIGRAISIVGGLRDSLDLDAGAVAANLDALYEYIGRRLLEANLHNDIAALEEVNRLLTPVANAWDQTRPEILATRARGPAETA